MAGLDNSRQDERQAKACRQFDGNAERCCESTEPSTPQMIDPSFGLSFRFACSVASRTA
jgi:hypothetical protein